MKVFSLWAFISVSEVCVWTFLVWAVSLVTPRMVIRTSLCDPTYCLMNSFTLSHTTWISFQDFLQQTVPRHRPQLNPGSSPRSALINFVSFAVKSELSVAAVISPNSYSTKQKIQFSSQFNVSVVGELVQTRGLHHMTEICVCSPRIRTC